MNFEELFAQNAETTSKIIEIFKDDVKFITCSNESTKQIIRRDEEDGLKLKEGIELSLQRGTLKPLTTRPKYKEIQVSGKSPDEVAEEIIADVGGATEKGAVIVIVGLSGTGKGTTVAKLAERIPNCVTWSNGNVFRCLTLLSTNFSKVNNMPVDECMTESNITAFFNCLNFHLNQKTNEFDILIKSDLLRATPEEHSNNEDRKINIKDSDNQYLVSDIKNTELKRPEINKNIPTVAKFTQGETVVFARKCVETMSGEFGVNVLLEGREQTVDYIDSPFRYCLVLRDENVIGMRRVAQILAASALKMVKADASVEEIKIALETSLENFEV